MGKPGAGEGSSQPPCLVWLHCHLLPLQARQHPPLSEQPASSKDQEEPAHWLEYLQRAAISSRSANIAGAMEKRVESLSRPLWLGTCGHSASNHFHLNRRQTKSSPPSLLLFANLACQASGGATVNESESYVWGLARTARLITFTQPEITSQKHAYLQRAAISSCSSLLNHLFLCTYVKTPYSLHCTPVLSALKA